jgi:exopolysaccharide production protein ExoY
MIHTSRSTTTPSRNATRSYGIVRACEIHALNLHTRKIHLLETIAKRAFDLAIAVPGLILLALLLPPLAACIWGQDRGPVFYKQIRVGRFGQPFTIYKLRTMSVNAERTLAQQPHLLKAWQRTGKLAHDPRVTPIGFWLRRTSLDELPQLLNVLRGEMSLVGPRPVQFSELPNLGPLQSLRQTLKPGLTGLWQLCGRSTTTYEQRALLDCTYVLSSSLRLDIHIVLQTLPALLHGPAAC